MGVGGRRGGGCRMMQGGMGPSKLGGQESLEGVGLKQLQAGGRGGGVGGPGGTGAEQ